MEIKYIKGDATAPEVEGNKIIAHICNDIGGWGRGFVLAISNKWKAPEGEYRKWAASKDNFELGKIQVVKCDEEIFVANMIGQEGIKKKGNKPPIRYEAVQSALRELSKEASALKASIHMPRIGCGLAGGKWEEIEPIIQQELIKKGVPVTVYDFE